MTGPFHSTTDINCASFSVIIYPLKSISTKISQLNVFDRLPNYILHQNLYSTGRLAENYRYFCLI